MPRRIPVYPAEYMQSNYRVPAGAVIPASASPVLIASTWKNDVQKQINGVSGVNGVMIADISENWS